MKFPFYVVVRLLLTLLLQVYLHCATSNVAHRRSVRELSGVADGNACVSMTIVIQFEFEVAMVAQSETHGVTRLTVRTRLNMRLLMCMCLHRAYACDLLM